VGEETQGEREGKEGENSGEGYGRGKGRHTLRLFVESVAICTASFSRSWLAMAVLSRISSTCVAHHDVGSWIDGMQTYTQTHKQVDRQKADRQIDMHMCTPTGMYVCIHEFTYECTHTRQCYWHADTQMGHMCRHSIHGRETHMFACSHACTRSGRKSPAHCKRESPAHCKKKRTLRTHLYMLRMLYTHLS